MRSQGLHRITSELIKACATCQIVNKSALKKMQKGTQAGFGALGGQRPAFVSLLGTLDAKKEQMSALFLFILGLKFCYLESGALFQCG